MGSVYKAYDRELDRMVALKVIRPGLVADPSAVRRFKQELLLGSKVSHRNILRIHDLGDVDGMKFISMAFVDGEDLHKILRREGRLPVDRAVKIARGSPRCWPPPTPRRGTRPEAAEHPDRWIGNSLSPPPASPSRSSAAAGMTRTGELPARRDTWRPSRSRWWNPDHRVDLWRSA
jgi:hypothetical protein